MTNGKETVKSKQALRTCVACGASGAKSGLVRFVRTKDGEVFCDLKGRSAGRGAYLCADEACFLRAVKHRRLERALKHALSEEDYQRLEEAFKMACQSGQNS